jgi:hypothetical protein
VGFLPGIPLVGAERAVSAEIYFDYCVSAPGQERTRLRLDGEVVGTSATTSEECRLLAERLKIIASSPG